MPLLVLKPSLCHVPPFYLVLCHCFKAMSLGSKTSHCSGNEPALLHLTDGWMHELSIVNCQLLPIRSLPVQIEQAA